MGRKPKPEAAKALAGNPGKRKPGKRATRAIAAAPLKWRPTFALSMSGQALFDRLAPVVREMGFVNESDLPALTRYAELLGIWAEASMVLRPVEQGGQGKYIDTPMTNGDAVMKRLHPAFNVLTRTESHIATLEAQFGFTPASRHSILARLAAGGSFGHRGESEKPDNQPALGLPEPESPVEFLTATRGAGSPLN